MILPPQKQRNLILLCESKSYTITDVARIVGTSRPTVRSYFVKIKAMGLTIDKANELDDDEIVQLFYPNFPFRKSKKKHSDFKALRAFRDSFGYKEKGKPTAEYLWQKELEKFGQDAYGRSSFIKKLNNEGVSPQLSMKQFLQPGDMYFSDFAGKTLRYGPNKEYVAFFIVGVFGYSRKLYVRATQNKTTHSWLSFTEDVFIDVGGHTTLAIHDNDAALVDHRKSSMRSRPVKFTKVYDMFCRHTGVIPAPIKSGTPEHNYLGENGVGIFNKVLFAYLLERQFLTLDEINAFLKELLIMFNDRKLKGRTQSRQQVFISEEQPALKPNNKIRFKFPVQYRELTVPKSYGFDHNGTWYSIPSELFGNKVEIIITDYEIEIRHKNKTVRVHQITKAPSSIVIDDMPPNHAIFHQQNETYFKQWAASLSEHVVELVSAQFRGVDTVDYEGWKSCRKLKQLCEKYGEDKFIDNCEFVVTHGQKSVTALQTSLKLDTGSSDILEGAYEAYLKTKKSSQSRGGKYAH